MIFKVKDFNRRFRSFAGFLLKYRKFLILLLLLIDGAALFGIKKVKTQSSWDSFFFRDDPVMVAKDKFKKVFGNGDSAGILFRSDDVFSPESLKIIRELSDELENNIPYADKIVSITDFEFIRNEGDALAVGNLIPDDLPEDKESIEKIRSLAFSKKDLVNKLFSSDSRETWISVRLKDFPESGETEKTQEPLYEVGKEINRIVNQEKYTAYDISETGMPVVAFDKTNFFQKEMGRTLMLAFIVSVIMLLILLRSARGILVCLFTCFSAVIVPFGIMGFTGIKIDLNVVTVPVYLALAVSIGYSIHLYKYFKRHFLETGKRTESVIHAVEHTGWPLLFTALTTIGCMLSFNIVKITALKWMGNAASAMVLTGYFFVIIMLPVMLSFGKDSVAKKNLRNNSRAEGLITCFGDFIMRHPVKIITVFCVLCVISVAGLLKLKVGFDVINGYGLKVPYVKRIYDAANSAIGSLYSYNVTIGFQEEGKARHPEMLKKMELLEKEIRTLPLTKNTSSVLDITKDMNMTMHGGKSEYYSIPDDPNLVSQLLLLYENSGGRDAEYWSDYEYKTMRLQVAISDFSAEEVERELKIINDKCAELFPGAECGMVGSFIEGAVVNNYVARGQIQTFVVSLLCISVFMIAVFGSVKAGFIALLPNIFPALLVGGIMGISGYKLDMMTMTIIPMVLGIAVDDTIHFINHIKYGIESGLDYVSSIRDSFLKIGTSLLMTSVILVVTFSMYATSVVIMIKVLGIMTGIALAAALICDYTLTPLLINITKPFGCETQTKTGFKKRG